MSLSIEFNNNTYTAQKVGDYVLQTYCNGTYIFYDFAARIMYGHYGSNCSLGTTPFSQLDREVLIAMRDKLVDLGGKPPELPAEAPAAPKSAGGFQL